MNRLLWIWCYFAFKLWLAVPDKWGTHPEDGLIGRVKWWLLEWAGLYAHSDGYSGFLSLRKLDDAATHD